MEPTAGIGAVIMLLPFLIMIGMTIFAITVMVFWIWMLVDCLTNEPSEGNDKIVWVLVIVFTNWIGAFLYLFIRRPTRKRVSGR